MKIVVVVIAGAALFIAFKLLHAVAGRLEIKSLPQERVRSLLPAVEFAAWLVFFFWALYYLLQQKTYFPYLVASLVIALVLLFGWFLMKDVVAGIVLRFQRTLAVDRQISFDGVSGRVARLGLTHALLITAAGDRLKTPYSRLSGAIIAETAESDASDHGKIILTIEKRESREQLQQRISRFLLLLPWADYKKPPLIAFADETAQTYTVEVVVYAAFAKHLSRIEQALEREFS